MSSSAPPLPSPLPHDRGRILWIRSGSCLPLHSGGRIYPYHLLVHLMQHFHVHVLELHGNGQPGTTEPVPYANVCERVCSELMTDWSQRRFFRFVWQILRNFFASREPFLHVMYRSKELAQRARELVQSGQFDLVIADSLLVAPIFEGWEQQRRIPAMLLQHNVEALIWKRLAAQQRNPFMRFFFHHMAGRMRRREPVLCRLFNGITTISEQDATIHRDNYQLSNVLGCIPAGATPDPAGIPPAVLEQNTASLIAFLGSMDWAPNVDAVFWFIQEILPRIRQTLPETRFRIIGSNPPEALIRLGETAVGIEVTGSVEEVSTPLRECALMAVPLRAGSGVRLKILESMSVGVPVVSTKVGAEGLPLRDGHELLLADDAPEFSHAVIRLLQDNALRQTIAEQARQLVARDFSWQHSAAKLHGFIAALMKNNIYP